jgi:hypothetical protein
VANLAYRAAAERPLTGGVAPPLNPPPRPLSDRPTLAFARPGPFPPPAQAAPSDFRRGLGLGFGFGIGLGVVRLIAVAAVYLMAFVGLLFAFRMLGG